MHRRRIGKLKAVARALYRPSRSAEEIKALSEWGFSDSDFNKDIEIWPENLTAVNLFQSLGTQWRVGMGGCTGLDYNVAYRKMDRMGLTTDEYDQLEADLQVLEYEALANMNSKK